MSDIALKPSTRLGSLGDSSDILCYDLVTKLPVAADRVIILLVRHLVDRHCFDLPSFDLVVFVSVCHRSIPSTLIPSAMDRSGPLLIPSTVNRSLFF
jgi:hypothetical protein